MKALIPAAGYGTRFLPASKTVPKEMLPVGAKPAIQLIVEEALAALGELTGRTVREDIVGRIFESFCVGK